MRARALAPVRPWCSARLSPICRSMVCSGLSARHRLLEDEADVVAAHPLQRLRVGGGHLPAAVAHRAGDVGVVGQEPHGRERRHRLARARFADDRQRLAGVELEAHAPDRLGALAALDEAHAEAADLEDGEGELAGVLHRAARGRGGAGSGRRAPPTRPRAGRCPRGWRASKEEEGAVHEEKGLGTHQRTGPPCLFAAPAVALRCLSPRPDGVKGKPPLAAVPAAPLTPSGRRLFQASRDGGSGEQALPGMVVAGGGQRKVFRGSKASRTPSKMKTSRLSMIEKVKKAVKPSQGALRRFLPCSASSPSEG